VSGAPNLEELSFGDCKKLIKNHESVGFLNKLKMLNADGCSRLVELFSYQIVNLGLSCCHVSDDFLRIGLPLFSNVKELYLSQNEFSTLPACIKECYLFSNQNSFGWLQESQKI
jgi:Leucine-rich repeat (LRR) protein